MHAFIRERQIAGLPNPDFAEDERLPLEARVEESESSDKGKRMMKNPLSATVSIKDREGVSNSLQQLLTGQDEEGNVKPFHMACGDLLHHPSKRVRNMAQGKLTMDVDSVLSLFTDLCMINCTIDIAIVWNPWRNLQSSVHLAHKGIHLHRIPHFFLGRFGRDLSFELYMFAPKAYDKEAKVHNGLIPNRLREETIVAFMDECFLKAVHKCIPPAQRNRWPSKYEIQKAKSSAAGIEGRLYRQNVGARHMELSVPLAAEFIPAVWQKCERYLTREIRRSNSKLSVLQGFQLFVTSKGTKDRLFTDSIPKLMSIYKDKVKRY